jgi:hypothetical protein
MKPTRMWWHLSQVLPLAEHAMAAPAHQLTGAQVAAKAPTQPALIWTSQPSDRSAAGDWLSSNGSPGWFDRDGATHQAMAITWQHTATGAIGSPGQPDPAMGFIPLTYYSLTRGWRNRPGLIDVLRRGADAGAHWFAFESGAIGPTRFVVADHRHDIAPPTATWTPATVTSPIVGDRRFPALIADGYTTGDGVIARFDAQTVSAIAAYLLDRHDDRNPATDLMPGELPLLGFSNNAVSVSWSRDDGAREWWDEVDRVYPDHEGRYAISSPHWRWSIAD